MWHCLWEALVGRGLWSGQLEGVWEGQLCAATSIP